MKFPTPPPPTEEELEEWDRKRASRLAKHPIDYDAIDTALAAPEEEEDDADEQTD